MRFNHISVSFNVSRSLSKFHWVYGRQWDCLLRQGRVFHWHLMPFNIPVISQHEFNCHFRNTWVVLCCICRVHMNVSDALDAPCLGNLLISLNLFAHNGSLDSQPADGHINLAALTWIHGSDCGYWNPIHNRSKCGSQNPFYFFFLTKRAILCI